MLATSVEELRSLLPARVQKASVDSDGSISLELYVHPRANLRDASIAAPDATLEKAHDATHEAGTQGEKRWLSIARGAVRIDHKKLARAEPTTEAREPPAVQGLLRKELVPSALVVVEVRVAAGEDLLVAALTFVRAAQKPRVLVVEHTADPRAVLCADAEDGWRVLGVMGGAARPVDGRDLRRGRLYEEPRGPKPAEPERVAGPREPATSAVSVELAALRRGLKDEARRLRRLVEALRADLARHGDAARHEEEGELLKTRLASLARGARSVDVVDWNGTPRTIELDPSLDGKGNLEARFKRARRAREAMRRSAHRVLEAERGLGEVEELRRRLALVTPSPGDCDDARRLLDRPDSGGSARRKVARSTPRKPWRAFTVAREVTVRVGRGARDNDALVKSARGNDLWLHARGHQGAHVIIPSSGDEVPFDVVRDAALLAAHFSSARGERHVDVQTARVKHLRKPGPGAPAGLVHVTHEVVVPLHADEARLRALLAAEVPAS